MAYSHIKPVINVIIPTRDRTETLYWTIKTCINQNYKNYKIWISDNFSEDNTFEIIRKFQDSRINYIKTPERLSMSHSWEFAISHIDEGYVIVIGDDDGLVPDSISILAQVIQETEAQAIRPPNITYYWPHCLDKAVNGMLFNLPLRSDYEWINSYEILSNIAESLSYHQHFLNLPTIYHGCIHIDVIKNITKRDGRFFLSCCPDMYSAVIVAGEIEKFISLHHPVCINGLSKYSIGISGNLAHIDNTQAKKFFCEGYIPFHKKLVPYDKKIINLVSRPILIADQFLKAKEKKLSIPPVDMKNLIIRSIEFAGKKFYKEEFDSIIEETKTIGRLNNLEYFTEELVNKTNFIQKPVTPRIESNFDKQTKMYTVDTMKYNIRNIYEVSLLISQILKEKSIVYTSNTSIKPVISPDSNCTKPDNFTIIPFTRENMDLYIVRTAILKALRNTLPLFKGTLLDVGCGYMPYKKIILNESIVDKYIGLDISDNIYQKPDIQWDGEKIPLNDNVIDSALATELFEHLPEPEKVMKEIMRVLKPGGVVFFTVPFLWSLHTVPNDEYRYTPFSLERHLKNSGFDDINIKPLGGWNASLAQMIGLWVRRKPMTQEERQKKSEELFPFYRELLENDEIPNEFSEGLMIPGLYGTAVKSQVVSKSFKEDHCLAIFTPHIGALSETFIRKHMEFLAPGKTVVFTGNIVDKSFIKFPYKVIPYSEGRAKYAPHIEEEVVKYFTDYNVTHILCEYGCYGTEIVELNQRRLHLPIFVHFHGGDAAVMLRRYDMVEYYRWMGQQVTGVIAVGKPMAERLAKIIPPEKIKIIHYGIEIPDKVETNPEQSPCKFIFVGRLVAKKAPLLLLKAFFMAKQVVKDIKLDIIGGDGLNKDQPGPLRLEVEDFIIKNNLQDCVVLHGGQSNEYVKNMLNNACVFVQHSITDPVTGDAEGLPNSILEASACGLPIISTVHEGIPEEVEHGVTGFLVNEFDIANMAEYMVKIASDGNLRKKMGIAAREKIQREFNVHKQIAELRDFIGIKYDASSRESVDLINELIKKGDLNDAGKVLDALIAIEPSSIYLLNLKAEIKIKSGEIAKAEAILLELLEKYPENTQVLNNLGIISIGNEQTEKSLEYFIKALKIDSNNKITILNIGSILINLGRYEEAEKLYLSYLEKNSYDEEILNALNTLKNKINIYNVPALSFIIIVLNGMPFIEFAIKAIYEFAHEIVIIEGAVSNCMFAANPDGSSTDGTVDFIINFPDREGKIKLIQGKWEEKVDMHNKALEYVTGDYVWLVDSDEIYKRDDIIKIIDLIKKDSSITQINFIFEYNFWKGFDYIFLSEKFFHIQTHRIFKFIKGARFTTHRPPTLFYPGLNSTAEKIHLVNGYETKKMGIIPFHYSYVLDSQVKQKIDLYNLYNWGNMWSLNLNEWYRDIYQKWTPENRLEVEKKYGPWTGDKNSYTEKFNGTHPEVMTEYISKFKSEQFFNINEENILSIIGSVKYQQKVLEAWRYIELDRPLEQRREHMTRCIAEGKSFWNVHVALAFLSTTLQPKSYLEVGVRTGGSFVQVVNNADVREAVAMDLWTGSYSDLPNFMDYTIEQINKHKKLSGKQYSLEVIKGNSHIELKKLIAKKRTFELINVDGDHSEEGAWEDLQDAEKLLAYKGAIVFDDIIHISFPFLLNLVYRFINTYPCFNLLINKTQDNGCAILLKNIKPEELLSGKVISLRKNIKIAGEVKSDSDLTAISSESEFQKNIQLLFSHIHPEKIIETGTYLGTGTTSIIASTLKNLYIGNSSFYSIEVNPSHYEQACVNLHRSGLLPYVILLNGISVPRSYLPTIQDIQEKCVNNIEGDDIFIDHKDHERALLYYKETDFEHVPEDLLGKCLKEFNYKPDFVLLDSAGHMGNVEFNYLISHLKGECYIALDDIYHIKHHKSFLQIQNDPRFELIISSTEKFGFCIAKFNPYSVTQNLNIKNLLWIRTDSIGDNILASSMLPYIRDKYKNATITVLCQKHIRELYEPCPFIDNIITFEKSRVYREECYRNKIIQKLKKLKPEISFNSVYSREPLTDVFSINCEARYTIAFNGDFANGMTEEIRQKNNRLYTTILSNDGEYKPELERHRDFLRNIGINVADIKPLVWITEKDEQFARDLFCKYNLHTEKTIVLFAGALVPVRLYKYYGKALSHVFKNNDITVIALGIDKDYEVSQSNLQDTGVNIINLCGKTTLRESAAIMKKCHLAIGAETGLAHLACAVGVRNVVILGGGHFGRFMPYSPLTSVVCLPLECYVCNWHCKYQKPHCVYDIIPEVFAAAIIQTIKKSSDKPRIFVQGKSLWSPSANQPVWALFDKYLNINNFDIITIDDISTNEIELAEAILLVNQLRETGLLEEALISSEEIIRKYPASPELLNLHAELKFQTGHFEEARSLFVNLADRFPHDSRILNNAGAALWNERNAEKAMDYLIKALAFDRDNRPAILNLGDILVSLNKYDDAISLFLSYMERNPYDEDIKDIMEQIKSLSGKQKYENIISEYISVVNELRQMGLIQDAYLTLSEATAQCQDSPELLNLQAEIQYQMGNIEEAKNNFLELSVRFSDHSQILNNLGVIYLQEGCPEKALEYYRKSLHVNPDDRVATLNLADLMITLNNIDEAERILSSYIERHKDDEIIRGFLDSVKEQKKEKVVVSEILEEIKEIMKDGELDLARLALKGLLCDHPDNPELLHLQDLINAQRKTSCQVKT